VELGKQGQEAPEPRQARRRSSPPQSAASAGTGLGSSVKRQPGRNRVLIRAHSSGAASVENAMSNELMSDEQFAASVKSIIDDAVDYVDGFVAPTRALATQYYRGDPLGNEEAGRSQVVMTELRDVVQAIVPSLLRIFTSSEHAVEYAPRNEAEVAFAEQATDYVNFVFYNDNPGFQVLLEAFKDALIRKTGIIKWRWSEDAEISEASYTGLDQASYNLLLEDKEKKDKKRLKIQI